MSTPSVTASVGWYPLSGKGYRPVPTQQFYWHPARRATMGPVQLQRPLDRELGMSMLPHGVYKGGVYSAGIMDIHPRVDDALAMLIYGLAGTVTSTGSGPYLHIFGRNDDTLPNKYMAFRKMIPLASGSYFGETYWDGKVMSMAFNAQAGMAMTMQVGVQALEPVPNNAPSGAGWQPTSDQGGYEEYTRVPIAARAAIEMPDGTPVTNFRNLSIAIGTGAPNPEAEMVLGSFFPHDITTLSRDITISGQVFWQNATLYSNMYYGGGSSWSWTPYTGGAPFDAAFETPSNCLSFNSITAMLGFTAQKVIWACQPIDLVGGDIVVMDMIGTVVNNVSWEDWRLYMRTDTPGASLAWPS